MLPTNVIEDDNYSLVNFSVVRSKVPSNWLNIYNLITNILFN